MSYTPERYRDPETGRFRWAVLHAPSAVFYFPRCYGRRAAQGLAAVLNRSAR